MPWTMVLAHTDPGRGLGEAGAQAPALWLVVAASLAVGLLPTLIGVWPAAWIRRLAQDDRTVVEGLLFGALLFFFADFLSITANLGVGVSDLLWRGGLLLSFLAAIAAFASLASGPQPNWLRVALLWALGLGFHAAGEGMIVGYNLTLGLAEAFEPLPIASFVIHKLVEGFSLAALLAEREGHTGRQAVSLAGVAALPLVLGAVAGVAQIPGTYGNVLYALGAGSTAFILPYFTRRHGKAPFPWLVASGFGFVFMTVAALLHEL